MKTIGVIYTDNQLSKQALKRSSAQVYHFVTKARLSIGDYIRSPSYTTPMQVVAVNEHEYSVVCKCCGTLSNTLKPDGVSVFPLHELKLDRTARSPRTIITFERLN